MVSASSSTSSPRTQGKPSSDSSANYLGIVQPKGFFPLPSDWVSEAEQFPSADGKVRLFGVTHHQREWKNPRALIVVHGMGEHGGRYLHFPHYLKDTVGAVFALDLRGHGRSEGLRGHVDSWDEYVSDVITGIQHFEKKIRERFPKPELHLFAHSMGGLVAIQAMLKHPNLPLASVNISAPLIGVKMEVPRLKKAAAAVLAKVWPTLQLPSEIDAGNVCSDENVVEAYTSDRLVHDKVTPRMYAEMTRAMERVKASHDGWNYNVQFYIPQKDYIVDAEAAMEFYRSLNYRDKSLKTFPEFFHESFNETGKEKAFEELRQWMLKNSHLG